MDKRLMIGDWVRVATKAGKKDVQVNNIDADGWIIYDGGVSYDYEPIPTDKKWLMEFGFIEDPNIPYLMHLYNEAKTPIMTMEKRESVFICTYKVCNNIGKIEIEFIHQFQHLCCLLGVALTPHCYD